MEKYLLDDGEIVDFLVRGYHVLNPAIAPGVHSEVCRQTLAAFVEGKNPANAIYERAPAIKEVLQDPQVVAALWPMRMYL